MRLFSILVVVSLGLDCAGTAPTLEPLPAYTSYPTYTPAPTYTIIPTGTPVPTGTPRPMDTPIVTQSPQTWEIIPHRDKLTDARILLIHTTTVEHNLEWPYEASTLVIRCQGANSGRYAVIIRWRGFMSEPYDQGYFKSKVRWDDRAPDDAKWNESTDNDATFHRAPYRFIMSGLEAGTVFIRIWDHSGSAHDSKFSLGGLRTYIEQNPDVCSHRGILN